MWNRCGVYLATFAAAAAGLTSLPSAASRNFAPDATFTGSSLAGWRTLGQAVWRAENGEIVGTARGGGWLVLERSYQDVAFSASFRCPAGCTAGILLRAEQTSEGGMKGIFTSLTEGDLASYRVSLDAAGREIARERLRPAGGGQVRVAPAADANRGGSLVGGVAVVRGGAAPATVGRGAPAATAGRGAAAAGRGRARGGGRGPQLLPNGQPLPIAPPNPAIRSGDWNTIELVLDANILRPFLNDVTGGVSGGVADEEFGRFGPIALFAGAGEVRFKDVAWKDLQPRVALPEEVSPHFRMQAVNEFYYAWGPDISDIDRDGQMDIVAGGYYYRGPGFSEAREIYVNQTIDPSTRYFNGQQYAYDFTGDGWPDVVNALFSQPVMMYVNPAGESRRWDAVIVAPRMTSEIALMKDLDQDGRLEFIFKDSNNQLVSAIPSPGDPRAAWTTRPISESGPWPNHGMGVGDVNGDGRPDVLNAFGWWEQPAASPWQSTWTHHPAAFGRWNRSSPGGAEMAVYDVNGDGVNDVVTSLQAHGWGLSWFEQKKTAGGASSFEEHPIMGDFSTRNAGGVMFSELHGSAVGDIDGDGLEDFITGKRFWSHLDTFIDPDPHGPPVLYVYRTVRNSSAPGGAEFVPELIHNRSGIGSAAAVYDLDRDGKPEIITSTKRGTFVFWNSWKR